MQAMKAGKYSDSPTHFKHHHYAETSVECQSHTSLHPPTVPQVTDWVLDRRGHSADQEVLKRGPPSSQLSHYNE
jgi:hypothetical protein